MNAAEQAAADGLQAAQEVFDAASLAVEEGESRQARISFSRALTAYKRSCKVALDIGIPMTEQQRQLALTE